jgi:hypothetical protein
VKGPIQLDTTPLRLSFRAPLFGARNLLRGGRKLQLPCYVPNDNRTEDDCAILSRFERPWLI